jgi:hypothetical protein
MSDEIKKDRSPNYPRLPLEQAIGLANRLYIKIGKAKVKPVVAIGALGYNGVNGASLTTLGTLNAYGLIERERGESVCVSQLAIKQIHPIDLAGELEARRLSALKPKVFSDLFSGGYHAMELDSLCNHLIQQGFTPDGARKASVVFKENISFSKLDGESIIIPNDEIAEMKQPEPKTDRVAIISSPPSVLPSHSDSKPPELKPVLAKYSIPLGANEATLIITGERLTADDFDALREYVELFKQQLRRESGLEKITGKIATLPEADGTRIKFLLALQTGQVLSCMSGAGTKFSTSDFINGQPISVIGERKADLILGRTPFFVFSSFEKATATW